MEARWMLGIPKTKTTCWDLLLSPFKGTVLLILCGIWQVSLSQVIVTSTNTEGAYTTGNMLDLADRLELYSPPTYDIPMLLDAALYNDITKFQDYKNNWIIDMSNIDPQEFAPEDPNYTLAVQRRGIPFFYLAKIIIIASLLLLVSRLFYGYLGGFRQKVKILKSPQKRIGNRIIMIGTGLYFFFSTQYIVATYYSIDTTQKYLTSIIYKYAKDSDSNVKTAYVVAYNDRQNWKRSTTAPFQPTTLRTSSSCSTFRTS